MVLGKNGLVVLFGCDPGGAYKRLEVGVVLFGCDPESALKGWVCQSRVDCGLECAVSFGHRLSAADAGTRMVGLPSLP